MKKNLTKEQKKISEQERESLELLQRAHEKQGKQLRVDAQDGQLREFDEIRELIGKEMENPEEKYSLYYNGIQKILKSYLPKGKQYEEGRKLIYDEKNIFLNRGKTKSENKGIRKSDGRMTYQEKMGQMLDLILDWVSTSQDPITLFHMLYDLNKKNGYGHEVYDETSIEYHKTKKKSKQK